MIRFYSTAKPLFPLSLWERAGVGGHFFESLHHNLPSQREGGGLLP